MEPEDRSSERSTTDDFLEVASSDRAYQDIELFNWLLAEALRITTRIARSRLTVQIGSGDIEDLAAKAIEKFYLKFDFAGLADLPIEHAKNRLFLFLSTIVRQTIVDCQRAMQRERRQQEQMPLPLIEISVDQAPAAEAVIRRLPKSEKEFLQLKLVDNLSYPEMQNYYAGPRKKPPSVSGMKTRMHRIIKRLRNQF
jgi:DNA-directed RNA polymerase specialized sigma24 family protein